MFYFRSHEISANDLLNAVLKDEKTATCSSAKPYRLSGVKVPTVEGYCVVTDWPGKPKCMIQTTNIIKMKFDICKRKDEDGSLEILTT